MTSWMKGQTRGQTQLDFAIGMGIFLITVVFVLAFVPGILAPFESGPQDATVASDRIADDLATGTLVTESKSPFLLDRECVIGFFALEHTDGDSDNNVDAYPANDGDVEDSGRMLSDVSSSAWWDESCRFNLDQDIFDRLGFAASSLNIHIRVVADEDGDGEAGLLCLDAAGDGNPHPEDDIIETTNPYDSGDACDMSSGDNDVAFETANNPPTTTGSVVFSRRLVHIEGGMADGSADASLIVEVW